MRNEPKLVAMIVLWLVLLLCASTASTGPIRIAMPSKSLTFLNFYLADKFGLFKSGGLEVTFPVGKADVQLAGVVSGEIEYIAAAGTVLRGAAIGLAVKALMFALDKTLFHMMGRPEINGFKISKAKLLPSREWPQPTRSALV
jgi:hypothetical protein